MTGLITHLRTFSHLPSILGVSLEARFETLVHEVELISIIGPIGEFVQVEGKIFRGDLVKHAHDAAPEEGPNILASAGVDVPRSSVARGESNDSTFLIV
jgi:hypothetical protein